MRRSSLPDILVRILLLGVGIAFVAVVLRLYGSILGLLPPDVRSDIAAAWQLLREIAGPAIPALVALFLIFLAITLFASNKRR
jgi:hypothetical protein